jgi:predicted CopG family antitoxin
MFMATKTLTIMDDAYQLLLRNKQENESFSATIRRILSNKDKKKFSDLFGILDKKTGQQMMKDLLRIRKEQAKLTMQRVASLK